MQDLDALKRARDTTPDSEKKEPQRVRSGDAEVPKAKSTLLSQFEHERALDEKMSTESDDDAEPPTTTEGGLLPDLVVLFPVSSVFQRHLPARRLPLPGHQSDAHDTCSHCRSQPCTKPLQRFE
eukprot:7391526-Prymnesium_polylepis.3